MRIIVAMPGGPAGERFESILRARGYDVLRIAERLTKRDLLESGGDIFIVNERRSIRAVLAAGLSTRPHVIAALPKLDDKSVSAAVSAGAMDVIATSAGAEELVARVTLPQRLGLEQDIAQNGRLRTTDAWRDCGGVLSTRVQSMLDTSVAVSQHEGRFPPLAARIRVTCREDGSTIDILAGCSKSSGKALIETLLPGAKPCTDTLRDCLREMSNMLAGSFKQAFMAEGVATTLGLPEDCGADAFTEAHESWTMRSQDMSIVLGIVGGRGGARMVQVKELQPGMVLQHDVLNASGAPFIRAGTALTERTVERLSEVLGGAFSLSVAEGRLDSEEASLVGEGVVLFEAG